jgi:hypothetical protein
MKKSSPALPRALPRPWQHIHSIGDPVQLDVISEDISGTRRLEREHAARAPHEARSVNGEETEVRTDVQDDGTRSGDSAERLQRGCFEVPVELAVRIAPAETLAVDRPADSAPH